MLRAGGEDCCDKKKKTTAAKVGSNTRAAKRLFPPSRCAVAVQGDRSSIGVDSPVHRVTQKLLGASSAGLVSAQAVRAQTSAIAPVTTPAPMERRSSKSAAFISTIDDAARFKNAHQAEAYVGLVPSERSSGEKQNRGGITKAGPPRLRWLLVQAAWGIVRSKGDESAPLRNWTLNIVKRRGYKVGVVALARKLCGILFAMMRDERNFEWTKATSGSSAAAEQWDALMNKPTEVAI